MSETFRLRRHHRYIGAAGLVFAVLLNCAFVSAVILETNDWKRVTATLCLAGTCFLMVGGSGLWLVLYQGRHELVIREGSILHRGLFSSKEMVLSEVTEARWCVPGGLVLKSASGRITIGFANYEAAEVLRLIPFFREGVADEVQTGWNLFAYKSLSGYQRAIRDKPIEGEVLLTRRRWDRFCLPLILASSLIGTGCWWLTGEARQLTAPVIPILLWLLLRASTPAKGMVVLKETPVAPEMGRWWLFLAVWGLVAAFPLIFSKTLEQRFAYPKLAYVVFGAIWVSILIIEVGLLDRRQRRAELEAADLAARGRKLFHSRDE